MTLNKTNPRLKNSKMSDFNPRLEKSLLKQFEASTKMTSGMIGGFPSQMPFEMGMMTSMPSLPMYPSLMPQIGLDAS
jgi:hypothetical protein